MDASSIWSDRFELVSCASVSLVTDALRLIAARAGVSAFIIDSQLADEEVPDYVDTLKYGPYLPVFFDNAAMMEMNQPLTIVRYIATISDALALTGDELHLPAADAVTFTSLKGQSDAEKVRADFATEAVLRFLRELVKSPLSGDALVKRFTQQLRIVAGILSQSSALGARTGATITYGDMMAWYFIHIAREQCGTTVLEHFSLLHRFYDALAVDSRVAAFIKERQTRIRTRGTAPAVLPAAAGAGMSGGGAAAAAATVVVPPVSFVSPLAASPPAVTSAAAASDFNICTRSLAAEGPVLITGASGFIGSWVTKALLERGYTVHATVRSKSDATKTAHLMRLPNAATHLRLFEADLNEAHSFHDAAHGCVAVFHTASPFFLETDNPEADLIIPAVHGTQAVMRAAIASPTVRRVVVTSSMAAIYMTQLPVDHLYTEDDWSDEAYLRASKQYYALSKLLAEREVWRIAKEEVPAGRRFDCVTLCPSLVLGPLLQEVMNTSCKHILDLCNGSMDKIPNRSRSFVDVRDVAAAHVLAYEQASASGRYPLSMASVPWRVVADVCKRAMPEARVPAAVEEGPAPNVQAHVSHAHAHELGVRFTPLEVSIVDCMKSLYATGRV